MTKRIEKQKVAFTLGEVLITLAIIGVVAAVTLPMLVKNYQRKVTATKLKQTYTILNNALKMSIAENGDWENWGALEYPDSYVYAEKYWKPYLKTVKTCKTPEECKYHKVNLHVWYCKDSNNNSKCFLNWYPNAMIGYVLANGTYVFFQTISSYNVVDSGPKTIYIDTNGPNEPNTYGKDLFRLTVSSEGILPHGYSMTTKQISDNCSKDGYKTACLTKIMKDGWQIKDDYPW